MHTCILPTDKIIKGVEDWLMDRNYFFIGVDAVVEIAVDAAQADDIKQGYDAMYSGYDKIAEAIDGYRAESLDDEEGCHDEVALGNLEDYVTSLAITFRKELQNTIYADFQFDATYIESISINDDRDLLCVVEDVAIVDE